MSSCFRQIAAPISVISRKLAYYNNDFGTIGSRFDRVANSENFETRLTKKLVTT